MRIDATLRILLFADLGTQTPAFQQYLEADGHRVKTACLLAQATELLRDWKPDLLIADETLNRTEPEAGLRLAELCREMAETYSGRVSCQAIMLVPTKDWSRFYRARRTGAHVIAKSMQLDVLTRYVETAADRLITDRVLGPVLFGFHGFRGKTWEPDCSGCDWFGSSLCYGLSEVQLALPTVRTVVLNALMSRRRGQSAEAIGELASTNPFLRALLAGHRLVPTAVKMEISRLRESIGAGLSDLGAPGKATDFLPSVPRGFERYRLTGNWQLVHIRIDGKHT
jgi:hypothetical protein